MDRNVIQTDTSTMLMHDTCNDSALYDAQMRKLQYIIHRADIRPGHRVGRLLFRPSTLPPSYIIHPIYAISDPAMNTGARYRLWLGFLPNHTVMAIDRRLIVIHTLFAVSIS